MEGRRLSLSNLDKVFYPATGFTKGQVIDYYTRIAPVLLPHLRGRHLTLKRYPDGVEGQFFYEKQCPGHRPDWVRTAGVWSRHNGREIDYCVADDLATVVWLANLADLEMHTPLALADDAEGADRAGVRPRPGAAGDDRRVRRGRVPAARRVRPLRARRVPEDVGLEGHAALRAAQHADDVPRDEAVRPGRRAGARAPPSRAGGVGDAQGPAPGEGVHRLEPERRAQDDRLRLLAAGARAPDGVDAGDVGRGRGRAALARPGRARVHERRGARARGRARRLLRARCSSSSRSCPS